MAEQIRVTPHDEEPPAPPPPPGTAAPPRDDASLGQLFRELAQESSVLVRQEVALAKAEIRQNVQALAKDTVLMVIGGVLLGLAGLVLTAFLAALLGELLGDEYWLGLLIVGLLYAIVGGVLLAKGRSNLQHDELKPDETIASLQEDKRWAQAEARDFKREVAS